MTAALPHCRFCATPLTESFVDLGTMPPANDYRRAQDIAARGERSYPLHARVCPNCLLVQVDHSVPADALFTPDYAYFSSFSASWVAHAKRYAEAMTARFGLTASALVAEVASNDGYLLQHFQAQGIPVLGIEPAKSVADAAIARGIPTEMLFFGEETGRMLRGRGFAADLMAANNVLAHVPDIRDFVAGFREMLKPQGVLTIEFPHLLNLIRLVQFDTIYHEHYSYLSLLTVEKVLASAGLRVFDVEELPTHGGSLRVFACHAAASHAPAPGLAAMREKEHAAGLDTLAAYRGFSAKAEETRRSFLDFLATARREGKSVAGYGAPAKGNTFLNYCGVGTDDIRFTVDRNPEKQGRVLPGSHIPILPPQALREHRPDYVVILPWNLAEEISDEWAEIRDWGGRFVVAVPQTRVL